VANWLNVPNALTILRMIMVFFMPGLFSAGKYIAAMVLFLAAGATDLLDGYIARKYNLITSFGKLMDPLADKLMLVVTLVLFAKEGWTPWLVPIIIILKELAMVLGGLFMLKKNTVVYANFWGKAATFLFTLAVVLTFLHQFVSPADLIVMWVALALSVIAMLNYAWKFMVKGEK